jgi:hypothetical protein
MLPTPPDARLDSGSSGQPQLLGDSFYWSRVSSKYLMLIMCLQSLTVAEYFRDEEGQDGE